MDSGKTLLVAGIIWLGLVALGGNAVLKYSAQAGPSADAGPLWPRASSLHPPAGRHTLIIFAHPQCACTRASLAELEKVMTALRGRLEAHVLFLHPEGFSLDWVKSDLWAAASSIPGVQVRTDPHGRETRIFGGATSGQALLYSPSGELLFDGGITPARGHQGDNDGRQSVVDFVNGTTSSHPSTPVFGCLLFSSSQ